MSSISAASVERVKEAADVVEIISAYTDLKRSGVRFTGLCPFHDERTPSFSVNAQDKLYHCFGCGVGGDVIKFVEEKEGLAFPDAVEALAERYGVELEREAEDPRAEAQRRERARLAELLERTASFYSTFLNDAPQASKARDYLSGRGLDEQALRDFGVGCAPGTWDTVLVRGQQAGYSVEEIEAAGLVLKSQKGRGHYDRFRSRIVFPIRDARGRMQGFGARALQPDQKPKYVNSPEGALYSKRRTLYGIERARPTIVKSGRALVVEGYTDVIACHQAQITDAVAMMGTAITPEQVKLLGAYAEEAVLALDADRAGREAMLRAEMVGGKRLRLRVARMPEGKDPADLLAGGDGASATAFRKAIEEAVDLPVFHARTLLDDGDLDLALGARPGAGRGGGGDRGDARLDHPRGADARGGGAVGCRPRAGREADRGGGTRSGRRRPARRSSGGGAGGSRSWLAPARGRADHAADPGPETAQAAVAPRVLSAREGRELGLLGMCVRLVGGGQRGARAAHRRALLIADGGEGASVAARSPRGAADRPAARGRGSRRLRDRGRDALRARAGQPPRDRAERARARARARQRSALSGGGERGRPTGRAPARAREADGTDRSRDLLDCRRRPFPKQASLLTRSCNPG